MQPRFPKIFKTFSSRTTSDNSRWMPIISRHSRLEYWAFTQHCLSKVANLVNNKLLTFFVTASSAYNFENDSLSLCTSARTVLSLSSNLLCRDRAIGMRSCLRNLPSEPQCMLPYFSYQKVFKMKIQVAKLEN